MRAITAAAIGVLDSRVSVETLVRQGATASRSCVRDSDKTLGGCCCQDRGGHRGPDTRGAAGALRSCFGVLSRGCTAVSRSLRRRCGVLPLEWGEAPVRQGSSYRCSSFPELRRGPVCHYSC